MDKYPILFITIQLLVMMMMILMTTVNVSEALNPVGPWATIDPCKSDESTAEWIEEDVSKTEIKAYAWRQLKELKALPKTSVLHFKRVEKVLCSKSVLKKGFYRVIKMVLSRDQETAEVWRECVVESREKWLSNIFEITYYKCKRVRLNGVRL